MTTTTKHTIDARGKKLGRVATQAAMILMGKTSASYAANLVADVRVEIVNAGKIDITAKKKQQKVYSRYSGYPGGLKTMTLAQRASQKGMGDALKDAIYGMIPGNRLRSRIMKNLTIKD